MGVISDALDTNLISRTVGYKLAKGNFSTTSPNLPQLIAIFGEMNTANQAASLTPTQITTAAQAGLLYGYGSPIYLAARVLLPPNGGGTAVPIYVYPQAAAGGAVAAKKVITPTGTATANGVHYVIINGRDGMDSVPYAVNILIGDTPTMISQKISDAVNAVLGAPAIGSVASTTCELLAKWTGLTSNKLNVSIETNGVSLGVTYAITSPIAGAGTPSVVAQLANIGSSWTTIIINTYGTESTTCAAFEAWNGRPLDTTPTGRYAPQTFKPAIVLTGSTADNDATFTDARLDDVTIAICPAPLSLNFPFEVAAAYGVLHANNASNTPHLDIEGQYLPDIIAPQSIGTMAIYANRQAYVLKGCSTADLVAGKYQVQDFVTTYHPVGETPPQYRYVRDLNVHYNVRYTYLLLEQKYVQDHAIANDGDPVSVGKVVKPKTWKAVLTGTMIPDLASRALIADVPFSKASVLVGINNTNPNRFDTAWSYKITGTARVIATTVYSGFNFGSN